MGGGRSCDGPHEHRIGELRHAHDYLLGEVTRLREQLSAVEASEERLAEALTAALPLVGFLPFDLNTLREPRRAAEAALAARPKKEK